ncbi:MAG: type 4a pilus biogenesis protein PilO [Eubacteriales bacterium]
MNLSKREKILIALLIFIAVLGVYTVYLLLPQFNQMLEHRKILAIEKNLIQELKTLEGSDAFVKEEESFTAQWNELKNKLPSQFSLPDIYDELMDIKNQSGVQYDLINFGMPKPTSEVPVYDNKILNQLDLSITLEGSHSNIKKYIEMLYSESRGYTISKISLSTVEEGMKASFIVNTYALLDQDNIEDTSDYSSLENLNDGE